MAARKQRPVNWADIGMVECATCDDLPAVLMVEIDVPAAWMAKWETMDADMAVIDVCFSCFMTAHILKRDGTIAQWWWPESLEEARVPDDKGDA